jgi:hypothetical protein
MNTASRPATDAIAAAMARAVADAGPAMAANFTHPAWAMSPEEFRTFWGETRLAAVGTVGRSGWPHAAPVEVSLAGDRFRVPTFADAVRLGDLDRDSRLVLTAWDDAYHAAIVYGRATLPAERRGMVSVELEPARIYAIRAPRGHHAWRGAAAHSAS